MRLRQPKDPPGRRQRTTTEDRLPVSATYAYSARRSAENLPGGRREPERRPPASRRRYWFGAILLFLISCCLYFISLSSSVEIASVNNNAPIKATDKMAYQRQADAIMASSIWNSNKLTVNLGQLKTAMLAKFPGLINVTATIPLTGHHLVIYVELAQPSLILNAINGTYVIDSEGRAISKSISGLSNLPLVTDQSGLKPKLESQALPSADVSFIQTLVAQLSAKNFTVAYFSLPPASDELDAHISGQTYYVKFNLNNNGARSQAGTYLATIAWLTAQHQIPSQYIDVRVDGRAYYQ